jgi:hypothetical protein
MIDEQLNHFCVCACVSENAIISVSWDVSKIGQTSPYRKPTPSALPPPTCFFFMGVSPPRSSLMHLINTPFRWQNGQSALSWQPFSLMKLLFVSLYGYSRTFLLSAACAPNKITVTLAPWCHRFYGELIYYRVLLLQHRILLQHILLLENSVVHTENFICVEFYYREFIIVWFCWKRMLFSQNENSVVHTENFVCVEFSCREFYLRMIVLVENSVFWL